MKVDRSKFLLVVGALSAATGVVVASASCATTSSSSKNDAGTSSNVDSGDDDFDSGSLGDSGGDAGNACLGDLPDASVADDAGDAATGCAALTGSGCASACDSVAASFKSGLAEDVRTCLVPAPTCEGGAAASPVASCVEKAVAKACPDTTATSTCTPLVAGCPADDGGADGGIVFNQATCEQVVRSLNQSGRDTFTSCITEGISGHCTADPSFCVQVALFQ
jgi:hypothetical protein